MSWVSPNNVKEHRINQRKQKGDNKGKTEINKRGWVWWPTPAIPTLGKAEAGRLLDVSGTRPARPTWQNPISTKTTKINQW